MTNVKVQRASDIVKLLLLITTSPDLINKFHATLSNEYIVLTADSLAKGADLLRTEQVNMVVVDASVSDSVVSWLKKYKAIPGILWIGIIPSGLTDEDMDRYNEIFHETVYAPLSQSGLTAVVRKAQERQDILSEIKQLKLLSAAYTGSCTVPEESPQVSFERLEEAIALSRTFTANFDLERLLNLFLDAVVDVVGVSRASLLLSGEEDGVYRIRASRGFHHEITSKLYLPSDSGMALWLSARGRILRQDKAERNSEQQNILSRAVREMEVLHSIVAVPVMHDGRLLGILNLDSKITGISYGNIELERIFVLSGCLGKAIQDIYNYQRVCYQKEYIQKILERMGSGVITVNNREEIIIFNPKAEDILKRKAADLVGRTADVLPRVITDMIRETVREGKVYRRHEAASEADGLFLEVDTYGLHSAGGEIIGGVVLVDDISVKKELSKEKKRGEELQTLNELVGRMAHELRNPLVSVRTFTQLMKERYNDPEFQDFFYTTVTGEVEKLNNLIEKLIAFVHPIEYKFEMVELGKILDDSIIAALKGVKQAELNIVKNYKSGGLKLRADKSQICRAFSYIFQNSFNAMAFGGTLTIGVEPAHSNGMYKISINDTGKGIPQEDLERVFDPFYTTPEKGIGLGLPLSQKIIEEHGGKVFVSSIPEKGTTLTVLLPVAVTTGQGV